MDKNLAAVIALLLTDGSVSFGKGNKIEIALDSTSEVLHDEFKRLMKETFNLKTSRYKIKSRTWSHEVGAKLVKYTGTYRTKKFKETNKFPDVHIPNEIKNAEKEIIEHFLKYAFTCDGSAGLSILKAEYTKNCWNFQKRIQLACKHPKLLEEYQELLQKLDIHSRISINQGKLLIESRKGIENFCKRIRFIEGVKISGKGNSAWKGLEKNDILKIYQFMYKISDSLGKERFSGGYWMKNFKTRNEIINFLRNNVKNELSLRHGCGKLQ